MDLVTTPDGLRARRQAWRAEGVTVGFVPTMGYLHEGHLALVDRARELADVVVLSVFVNPLQFGPAEDLTEYPRDVDRDERLARERGVALLFVPSTDAMYPDASDVRVTPGATADRWEGKARPGHFTGVLTVVAKLFHLVEPHVACFGQKDYQQLALIRHMVRDLNWPIEIVGVPTVRESDGLAMSSRNVYLSPNERRDAVGLSAGLGAAHEAWCRGEDNAEALERIVRQRVAVGPSVQLEYIAVVDPDRLQSVDRVEGTSVIAVAARVGSTRLIDNIVLSEGLSDSPAAHSP